MDLVALSGIVTCSGWLSWFDLYTRLQDEYEELLKYAVVVPKIDVDDLPRVLADNKRAFTQSLKLPAHLEQQHSSHSGINYNHAREFAC